MCLVQTLQTGKESEARSQLKWQPRHKTSCDLSIPRRLRWRPASPHSRIIDQLARSTDTAVHPINKPPTNRLNHAFCNLQEMPTNFGLDRAGKPAACNAPSPSPRHKHLISNHAPQRVPTIGSKLDRDHSSRDCGSNRKQFKALEALSLKSPRQL